MPYPATNVVNPSAATGGLQLKVSMTPIIPPVYMEDVTVTIKVSKPIWFVSNGFRTQQR